MRRLTRSQRLLIELQRLTDAYVLARERAAAFRSIVEAVARNDFMAATAGLDKARPFLQHVTQPQQRRYTMEFKLEVVRLIMETASGSRSVVARKLGLKPAQIYQWVRLYKEHKGFNDNELPELDTGTVKTAELEAQLNKAKAAFSHLWKGGERPRGVSSMIPSAQLSAEPGAVEPRKSQQAVARKNATGYRRV